MKINKEEWIEHVNNLHLNKTNCNACNCGEKFTLYHLLAEHFVSKHITKIYICPCSFENESIIDTIKHFLSCKVPNHNTSLLCEETFDSIEPFL